MSADIGIIGYGSMGQWMAEAFSQVQELRIRGVAEIAPANVQVAEASGLEVFSDYRRLLDLTLDGVYIASPNHLHKEHVLAAARRHIPIFCEKPLALALSDVDEMAQAVHESGVQCLVNFAYRFSPTFERLREYLLSGELGSLLTCWFHSLRGYGFYQAGVRHPAVVNPSLSGGWVLHHAIHAVDWLLSLGGKVACVTAHTFRSTPASPSPEGVIGLLHFESSATGQVIDSVVGYREHSAGIIGAAGTATYGKDGVVRFHAESHAPESGEEVCTPLAQEDWQYVAAQHFAEVITGTAAPKATMQDGRFAQEVTVALLESARQGLTVQFERQE